MRTWAPRGQTPVLKAKLSRDHLSIIGGITASGLLTTRILPRAFKGPDVVRFLQQLLQRIPGKIIVIWDGGTIHRSKVVKKFLSDGAAARLHLEQLPSYAPDLNAIELLWAYLKNVLLPNRDFGRLGRLWDELTAAFAKLRKRPELIQSFIRHVAPDLV